MSTSPNFEVRVSQYVKLRDMIKAIKARHTEELEKPTATLEKLNGCLLAHLTSVNADSAATAAGTVSKTVKNTATIADMSAFWAYVVTQGDFDILDKKANSARVKEYIEANHCPPPGVNFTSINLVRVTRKSGT